MGLRSPQKMQTVKLRPEESTRFQGAVAPQIDTGFIDVLSSGLTAVENQRRKAMEEQKAFLTKQLSNETDRDIIAELGELTNAKGLNAADELEKRAQALQKKWEKRKEKIPEMYHGIADNVFAEKFNRFNRSGIPYVNGEARKVKDEVDKTYIANTINEAVEGSADLGEFNDSHLAKLTLAVMDQGRRNGLPEDQIKYNVEIAVSDTIKRAIEAQAKLGALSVAGSILKSHNDELTPTDRNKAITILEKIQKERGTKTAINLAEQARNLHGDDSVARANFIKAAAANDTDARQALDFDKAQDGYIKRQKQLNEEKEIAKIHSDLINGKPLSAEMLSRVPEKADEIMRNAEILTKRLPVKTDMDTFRELERQLNNDKQAFAKRDLTAFRTKLDDRDYMNFERAQRQLNKELQGKEGAGSSLSSSITAPIVKAYALPLGIRSSDPEYGELEAIVFDEFMRIKDSTPNITRDEMQKRIKATLLLRGSKPITRSTWFGLGDDEIIGYEIPDTLAEPSPENAHPSWSQSAAAYLESQGRRADPETVTAILKQLIKQGKDITRPRE